MKYYQLIDDINFPQRWYLGDIIGTEDNWQFTEGQEVNESLCKESLHILIYQDGQPMDYTIGSFSVPIVSERVKIQLGGIKNLQFIPVIIKDRKLDSKYFIMVVTSSIGCVNEALSEFGKFVKDDPVRPDLAGQYSWFTKLIVDPSETNGEDIFRIDKTRSYLVVSERVKDALEDANITGVKFIEAS
jgi:hypothetical protein